MGNPVAVVLEADGLDAPAMQRIAAWTNLSETTFIMPAATDGADYRLRIFTPGRELPFAGHPTVGSAHAVLEAGLISACNGRLVQECGAGLITMEITGTGTDQQILVTSPDAVVTPAPDALCAGMERAMGITINTGRLPLIIDVGPRWMVLECEGKESVQGLTPDFTHVEQLSRGHDITGITAFGFTGVGAVPVYVRSFAPREGIPEDPVCGSGNISVAAYLLHKGLVEKTGQSYTANQGLERRRDGFVQVSIEPETKVIKVGGHAVTCIEGYISC